MFVQRLRRRLFGYKKGDVFAFIAEMDAKAAEKLSEKDREIEELKNKIAELEANSQAVVRALVVAEEKSREMIDDASAKADAMLRDADKEISSKKAEFEKEMKEKREALALEIQTEKSNVNREIEVKRKAIKNYYDEENKKIDRIKNEVDRMRKASMEAIHNFENQLMEVERMSENSRSYLGAAKGFSQTESAIESFNGVERDIPVHIVESIME